MPISRGVSVAISVVMSVAGSAVTPVVSAGISIVVAVGGSLGVAGVAVWKRSLEARVLAWIEWTALSSCWVTVPLAAASAREKVLDAIFSAARARPGGM